jgi:hypothetical protein
MSVRPYVTTLILAPQVPFQKVCSVFFHPWSVKVQWYWRGTVVSPLWCSVRQQAWYSTTLHCVCNRGGGSTWRPSSASGLAASVLASRFMIPGLKHLRYNLIYWSSLHSKFLLHFQSKWYVVLLLGRTAEDNVADTEAVLRIQVFWAEIRCPSEWFPMFFKHHVTFIFKGPFICLTVENEGTAIVRNVGNYTSKTRRHIPEHRTPQHCRCDVLKSRED